MTNLTDIRDFLRVHCARYPELALQDVFKALYQSAFGCAPALCLLAILLGRALVRMGSLGSKFFYLVIALLFLHAGMLLAALHFPVALE